MRRVSAHQQACLLARPSNGTEAPCSSQVLTGYRQRETPVAPRMGESRIGLCPIKATNRSRSEERLATSGNKAEPRGSIACQGRELYLGRRFRYEPKARRLAEPGALSYRAREASRVWGQCGGWSSLSGLSLR